MCYAFGAIEEEEREERMSTVRDKLWLWGHEAGSHNGAYKIPGASRITPAEAAYYMGMPNVIMVNYRGKPEPPFDQFALALSPLKRVVWSIVGAGGEQRDDVSSVIALADRFPNIRGAMMDDFFHGKGGEGKIGTYTPAELGAVRRQLKAGGRNLDLWVVLYENQLDFPVSAHLGNCDVLTYWTWLSDRLANLERDFERAERLAPTCRKVLGCYLWDYGNEAPMPVDRMERQCEIGRRWLLEGRIEGMAFVAGCICDLGLEAVEWTRQWVRDVGCEVVDTGE